MPVKVTVRFRLFPEDILIRYKGAETLKFYVTNSLKEVRNVNYKGKHYKIRIIERSLEFRLRRFKPIAQHLLRLQK